MVRYTLAEKIEICEIYHRTGSIINENVLGNLWISDETYFCLSGVVNKQNMRFWGLENPHVTHEQPLHDEKLLVWCAMSEHRIIGLFVFDDTFNSQRYREMLNNFFFPLGLSEYP